MTSVILANGREPSFDERRHWTNSSSSRSPVPAPASGSPTRSTSRPPLRPPGVVGQTKEQVLICWVGRCRDHGQSGNGELARAYWPASRHRRLSHAVPGGLAPLLQGHDVVDITQYLFPKSPVIDSQLIVTKRRRPPPGMVWPSIPSRPRGRVHSRGGATRRRRRRHRVRHDRGQPFMSTIAGSGTMLVHVPARRDRGARLQRLRPGRAQRVDVHDRPGNLPGSSPAERRGRCERPRLRAVAVPGSVAGLSLALERSDHGAPRRVATGDRAARGGLRSRLVSDRSARRGRSRSSPASTRPPAST